MEVYILTFISSVLILYLCNICVFNGKRASLKMSYILATIPIIINASIRYNVGNDYNGYISNFYAYKYGTPDWGEPIYAVINKLLIFFDANYQWLFFIFAVIFIIPIFLQIQEDSPIPTLSIYLLFATKYYFAYLNISRQLCACAILFYSIRFIEKKDLKKFIVLCVIASGMHTTSIVFIPMYFLANYRFTVRKAAIITSFLFVLKPSIENLMTYIFQRTKYVTYLGTYYDYEGAHYFNLLIQGVIFLMAIMFRNARDNEENKKYNIYINFQLMAIWTMMYSGSLPLIDRMRFYFTLPAINLLAMASNNIQSKLLKRMAILGLVICFGIYVYVGIYLHGEYNTIPYQTIFSK